MKAYFIYLVPKFTVFSKNSEGWFQNNNIKSTQDKCHLLISGYKHENVWAHIEDEIIWESNTQK